MNNLLKGGVVTGLLAFAGGLTVLIGKPALGVFLQDPKTAADVTLAVSSVAALVGGFMRGWNAQ